MKKYKLIIDFNTKNEQTIYFDNFTKKRLQEISNAKNYILFSYNDFMQSYISFDFKLSEEDKIYFNKTPKKWSY